MNPNTSCAYWQACLDPLGVENGKVSNRAEAASQETVKLFQSFIAETWEQRSVCIIFGALKDDFRRVSASCAGNRLNLPMALLSSPHLA